MNFIVTPAGIRDMMYDTTFQEAVDENSFIFVLYEPDDIARIADIALLMDTKASISYICASNRDDKLLCIGAIKVHMNCMIFDKELNIETTYFDRIAQLCNVISSDVSKSEKKTSVVEAENVKQMVEIHENVEDTVASSKDGNNEDNDVEGQESVSETESQDTKNVSTEEIQDSGSENVNTDESDKSIDGESDNTGSSDEENVQESESNSDESDVNDDTSESSDNESDESESNEDFNDENTEAEDDVPESFGAAPDDVEEPDVDSMLEEKEHDIVDDEVGETFESSHEDKESTEVDELTEGLLPEGTKNHPFDTRNSNGLNDRQQAMYNIVHMFPRVTKMTIGEYMDAIISIVTLTEDESLIESKICELESGPIIWNRIKNCLDDIREIAR